MAAKNKKPKLVRAQKQKMRISIKIIIAGGVSILSLIAGIFVYLNVSNVEVSKAKGTTSQVELKPVDFSQPALLVRKTDLTINGVRVKKAIDLTALNQ